MEMEKTKYESPRIERVVLDNTISLVLESSPPAGPGESMNNTPDNFNNDPFKSNIV
jgi:hypothetical protein